MSIRASRSIRSRLSLWVPEWWAGRAGKVGRLADLMLAPAEVGYRGVMALRNVSFQSGWLEVRTASLPVISVGNLSVGGAGKTPFTAWMADRLAARGCRPGIILRGYGQDEVLVHRHLNPAVPVFANPRRLLAVRAAEREGCRIVLLDDGFQHRRLSRDLDLVLIAAESWQDSRRLLPRGPWRESLPATCRADLLVVTRKSARAEAAEVVRRELENIAPGKAIVHCWMRPTQLVDLHSDAPLPHGGIAGEEVLAVAALAAPASFVTNLQDLGAKVELLAYPDHHEFTAADAAALTELAGTRRIVMTLKDAVKLRILIARHVLASVLHQEVVIESGASKLEEALNRVVEGRCG